MALALLFVTEAASAQGWWPFGGGGGGGQEEDRPPIPQEPVYRQPPPADAPPPQQYSPAPPPPAAAPASPGVSAAPPVAAQPPPTNWSTKNPICYQLEQRLVQEGQKNGQTQNDLPRVESDIRALEKVVDQTESQLDHGCYEYFLFTKSLKNTAQCKDLSRQVDASKRRLADLDARRQDILGSAGRSYQDDIVRELARNNCGANYTDMARRSGGGGGMWEDEESSGGNTWNPQAANGAQTYRTLCVRLCDGFYFPVSFSTLPSHFSQDADACTSKCAAPTELYYYPNPGGAVEQSVALKTQEPYTKLKFAFRYRKEYVNGCSCKTAEYVPPEGTLDKKAEATTPRSSEFPVRRAEGAGSTADHDRIDGCTAGSFARGTIIRRAGALTLSRPTRVAGRRRPSRSRSGRHPRPSAAEPRRWAGIQRKTRRRHNIEPSARFTLDPRTASQRSSVRG